MAETGKTERDDFWDIDKLVPKKRGTLSPFASSDPAREYSVPAVPVTEIDLDGDKQADGSTEEKSAAERKLSFADNKGVRISESETYHPEGGLIKSVTVHHFIDRYDFYDTFRKSAEIFFDYKTDRCEFAQFYSYMPQYSQLNREQKNYYFYWRSEMRRGRYIKTDYSYVYLYVYEILNLPDRIPPAEGIRLLCRLWREYRKALPRLDNYFSIWVQDYCLVHRLPCPMDEIGDFIFDVISVSSFKEFYLSGIGRNVGGGTAALLAYLSDYDWRKGKYAAGLPEDDAERRQRTAAIYRTHMEGAMNLVLREVVGDILGEDYEGRVASIRRDAFPNSLCTHRVKRKLEIEYYPIAEAQGLRRGVTSAVRYAENKLRALIGVKSRLAVKELPDSHRRIIDYYFEAIFDRDRRERERAAEPAYERLYDAPRGCLSFAGADEIEKLSWDTTLRLVDTEELYDESSASVIATPTEQLTEESREPAADIDTYGLTAEEIGYIASFFGGEFAICERDATIPEESLADRINEAFSDSFGDIILEQTSDGYAVIEDYEEEIREWLTKILK